MIDFNRQPSQKSENEKIFDELNAEYEQAFGDQYSFRIGIDFGSWEDVIADIRRRIAEKDPQEEPDYNTDNIY